MLAIHNDQSERDSFYEVANAYAKLSKCQQFTTHTGKLQLPVKLQTLMQSYQNVSNSQLLLDDPLNAVGCKRLCKVIKMLAIHNQNSLIDFSTSVANAYAKLSKCQQFTTITIYYTIIAMLQTLMQSYQNVSNSQLKVRWQIFIIVANAYAKLSKCQQFTTNNSRISRCKLLQTLMQSYQNVSNSQQYHFVHNKL